MRSMTSPWGISLHKFVPKFTRILSQSSFSLDYLADPSRRWKSHASLTNYLATLSWAREPPFSHLAQTAMTLYHLKCDITLFNYTYRFIFLPRDSFLIISSTSYLPTNPFKHNCLTKTPAISKTISISPTPWLKVIFAKSILLSSTNRFIPVYYPWIEGMRDQSSICTLDPVSWYVINEPAWPDIRETGCRSILERVVLISLLICKVALREMKMLVANYFYLRLKRWL